MSSHGGPDVPRRRFATTTTSGYSPAAGQRHDPASARTLAIIDTSQSAGLTLNEIQALLGARPDNEAAMEQLRIAALRKLPELRAEIEHAMLVNEWLATAAQCQCPSFDDCGLFTDPTRLAPKAIGDDTTEWT